MINYRDDIMALSPSNESLIIPEVIEDALEAMPTKEPEDNSTDQTESEIKPHCPKCKSNQVTFLPFLHSILYCIQYTLIAVCEDYRETI
jgi:hypothetical protein